MIVSFKVFLCGKEIKLHLYNPRWQSYYLRMKEVKTGRFQLDVRKHCLTSKAIQQWNDLSWEVVSSPCV